MTYSSKGHPTHFLKKIVTLEMDVHDDDLITCRQSTI